jgi:hypothetical protein
MKPVINFFSISFSILFIGSAWLNPAWATTVLPISLEQLSTRASLIFYGSVVSNQVKEDEVSGQIATYTQFKIIDLIKGEAGTTHTIKQLGGTLESRKTSLLVHGVPKFQAGSNYVVFLPKASSLGFCSPLGLHQGRFSVITVNGEQIVTNGKNLSAQQSRSVKAYSSSIQLPLAVSANNPSQSNLNDFINTVRAYNAP